MAMQALTVRGIETPEPQAKWYQVFDTLTPGLAIPVTSRGHKSWGSSTATMDACVD